jgi:N-acetylglutamate synthase-like GNAT family acetyltransferase
VTYEIRPCATADAPAILDLTQRAWAPVFEKMRQSVPGFVYAAFYPDGWWARQKADVEALLAAGETRFHVAEEDGAVLGFVGIRLLPEDQMGEIHIIAVDPGHQRRGIARALMETAFAEIRGAGMKMVMVETGGDPGHEASRATYESAGFERWPVARYFKKL